MPPSYFASGKRRTSQMTVRISSISIIIYSNGQVKMVVLYSLFSRTCIIMSTIFSPQPVTTMLATLDPPGSILSEAAQAYRSCIKASSSLHGSYDLQIMLNAVVALARLQFMAGADPRYLVRLKRRGWRMRSAHTICPRDNSFAVMQGYQATLFVNRRLSMSNMTFLTLLCIIC